MNHFNNILGFSFYESKIFSLVHIVVLLLITLDLSAQAPDQSSRSSRLQIQNVGRNRVVKSETAWIPIKVLGCKEIPSFSLFKENEELLENLDVIVKSENEFYALFDLSSLGPGSYGIMVNCGGETDKKTNCLNISSEQPIYNLESELVLSGSVNTDSSVSAYIDFSNKGNVDAPVPLFILNGQKGNEYIFSDGSIISDEALIIGINENGLAGTLLPGETHRLSFKIINPDEVPSVSQISMRTIALGCEGMDQPLNWETLGISPQATPEGIPQEIWADYCAELAEETNCDWNAFSRKLSKSLNNEEAAPSDFIDNYEKDWLYSRVSELYEKLRIFGTLPEHARSDIEPGTIFIWDGMWKPLVRPKYKQKGDKTVFADWEIVPKNAHLFKRNASKNFLISHGWNDNLDGGTKALAESLAKTESGNIFCVDWSVWSCTYDTGLFSLRANLPARKIPKTADRAISALCKIFGEENPNNLRINNFHLIGHSHGAHVCGMIAHKLPFNPMRMTALDASTYFSHAKLLYFPLPGLNSKKKTPLVFGNSKTMPRPISEYLFCSLIPSILDTDPSNDLGTGWGENDVDFLDYYKSSVMAGTWQFKGHNNFILIEDDGGFEFSHFSDEKVETWRHGFSIEWFAQSMFHRDLSCGYWIKPNTLKDKWNGEFNTKQIHGVINAKTNRIENFDIRNELYATGEGREPKKGGISKEEWNYTKPWYEAPGTPLLPKNALRSALLTDKDFRDALATTIEYETKGLKYRKGMDYVLCGENDKLIATVENHADNFSVPYDIRNNSCNGHSRLQLYIGRKGCKPAIEVDKNGKSKVSFDNDVILLAEDSNHGYLDCGTKDLTIDFEFKILPFLWNQLGGTDEDDYIECEFFLVGGVNTSVRTFDNVREIDLSKGELYPYNNLLAKTLRVQNPGLACDAGKDCTYYLEKGQKKIDVRVEGYVLRDNGKKLSYEWLYKNKIFGRSPESSIRLGKGTHNLTFKITEALASTPDSKDSSEPLPAQPENFRNRKSAQDDVTIRVMPYQKGKNPGNDTPLPPVTNFLPKPFTKTYVVEVGYGGEHFKTLGHYANSSSACTSFYFGRTDYFIPKFLERKFNVGIDYGLGLGFTPHKKGLVAIVIENDRNDTDYAVKLRNTGYMSFGFGPAFSFGSPSCWTTIYSHVVPTLMYMGTVDTYSLMNMADDERCGWLGFSDGTKTIGKAVGIRCFIRNVGASFEWGTVKTNSMDIIEPFFDYSHDRNTGKTKMNTEKTYWRISASFSF